MNKNVVRLKYPELCPSVYPYSSRDPFRILIIPDEIRSRHTSRISVYFRRRGNLYNIMNAGTEYNSMCETLYAHIIYNLYSC